MTWSVLPAGRASTWSRSAGKLQAARNNRHARIRTGNRGYDLTLDLPKSVSVLHGLADPDLAVGIESIYTVAVHETVTAVETWAGYGMRGHHGGTASPPGGSTRAC